MISVGTYFDGVADDFGFIMMHDESDFTNVVWQRNWQDYQGISISLESNTELIYTLNGIDVGDTDGRSNRGSKASIGKLTFTATAST